MTSSLRPPPWHVGKYQRQTPRGRIPLLGSEYALEKSGVDNWEIRNEGKELR